MCNTNPTYKQNWVFEIKQFFIYSDLEGKWAVLGTRPLDTERCVSRYGQFLYRSDVDKKARSTSLIFYPYMSTPDNTKNSIFLSLINSSNVVRAYTQFRLQNNYKTSFLLDESLIKFKENDVCFRCKLLDFETFEHVTLFCPYFNYIRFKFFDVSSNFDMPFWLSRY